MSYHSFEEQIKSYEESLNKQLKNYRLYKMFKDYEGDVIIYNDKIVLRINDLKELPIVKKYIEKVIKNKWNYKINQIWNGFQDIMLISYKDNTMQNIEVWIEKTVDNFPKELLKDSCKLVKETKEHYNIVCEVTK